MARESEKERVGETEMAYELAAPSLSPSLRLRLSQSQSDCPLSIPPSLLRLPLSQAKSIAPQCRLADSLLVCALYASVNTFSGLCVEWDSFWVPRWGAAHIGQNGQMGVCCGQSTHTQTHVAYVWYDKEKCVQQQTPPYFCPNEYCECAGNTMKNSWKSLYVNIQTSHFIFKLKWRP